MQPAHASVGGRRGAGPPAGAGAAGQRAVAVGRPDRRPNFPKRGRRGGRGGAAATQTGLPQGDLCPPHRKRDSGGSTSSAELWRRRQSVIRRVSAPSRSGGDPLNCPPAAGRSGADGRSLACSGEGVCLSPRRGAGARTDLRVVCSPLSPPLQRPPACSRFSQPRRWRPSRGRFGGGSPERVKRRMRRRGERRGRGERGAGGRQRRGAGEGRGGGGRGRREAKETATG